MSQQINLFNPVFLYQKKPFGASTMALAAGVLVLGLAALGAWGELRVARLQGEVDRLNALSHEHYTRLVTTDEQFQSLRVDYELLREHLEAMEDSLSWRVTTPLRALRGRLGRGPAADRPPS